MYDAMRVVELSNKHRRAHEELQLLRKEMQQLLAYCQDKHAQIRRHILGIDNALLSTGGSRFACDVQVSCYCCKSTSPNSCEASRVLVKCTVLLTCSSVGYLHASSLVQMTCSTGQSGTNFVNLSMQAVGRYLVSAESVQQDPRFRAGELALLHEARLYYAELHDRASIIFRPVLGQSSMLGDNDSMWSERISDEHVGNAEARPSEVEDELSVERD